MFKREQKKSTASRSKQKIDFSFSFFKQTFWFYFSYEASAFLVLVDYNKVGRQTTNSPPMAELSAITGYQQPNQFPRLLIFLMVCLFY